MSPLQGAEEQRLCQRFCSPRHAQVLLDPCPWSCWVLSLGHSRHLLPCKIKTNKFTSLPQNPSWGEWVLDVGCCFLCFADSSNSYCCCMDPRLLPSPDVIRVSQRANNRCSRECSFGCQNPLTRGRGSPSWGGLWVPRLAGTSAKFSELLSEDVLEAKGSGSTQHSIAGSTEPRPASPLKKTRQQVSYRKQEPQIQARAVIQLTPCGLCCTQDKCRPAWRVAGLPLLSHHAWDLGYIQLISPYLAHHLFLGCH